MDYIGKDYRFSGSDSDRIKILKVIAIIFVLFMHSFAPEINLSNQSIQLKDISPFLYQFEYVISNGIARCGNAIFFFISGLLIYSKKRLFMDVIRKKVRTLLIPFLFWNTFWIIIFIIFQEIPYTSNFFSGSYSRILDSNFIGILKLYGIGLEPPLANQLWFLRDLCLAALLSPFIWKFVQASPIIMSLIGWGGYILLPSIPLKGAIYLYIAAASFITMDIKLDFVDKFTYIQVFMVNLVLLVLSQITNFWILKNLFDCVSIFTWMYIAGKLLTYRNSNLIFKKLSEWTFMIYVLHNIPLQFIKKFLIILFPVSPILLGIEFILLPVIVMFLCVLAGVIFKKIMPKIYNLSAGSR